MANIFHRRPVVNYTGDKSKAESLLGFASNELAKLKNLMSFNKLEQDVRTVRLIGGAEILCRSMFGQDFIDIYVPEAGGEIGGRIIVWTGSSYKGIEYAGSGWMDRLFFIKDSDFVQYDFSMMHFYTLSAQCLFAEIDDNYQLPDLEAVLLIYIPNLYRALTDAELNSLQVFTARGGKLIMAGDWLQLSGYSYFPGWEMGNVPSFHDFTNAVLEAVNSPLRVRLDLDVETIYAYLPRENDQSPLSPLSKFLVNGSGSYQYPSGKWYQYSPVMFNPLQFSSSIELGSYYPWMIWHTGIPSPCFVSNPTSGYPVIHTTPGYPSGDVYSSIFPTPCGNYMAGKHSIVDFAIDSYGHSVNWPGRIWFESFDFFSMYSETEYKPLAESTWVCHVPTNTMLLGFTTWSESRDYYLDRARFHVDTWETVNGWDSRVHAHVRRHDIIDLWEKVVFESWSPVEIDLDPSIYLGTWSPSTGGHVARMQVFPGHPLSTTPVEFPYIPVQE